MLIEANLGAPGNIIGSIPFVVSIVEAFLILLRLFSTVLNIMRVMTFMSTLLEQVLIEANLGVAGNTTGSIPFVMSVVEPFLQNQFSVAVRQRELLPLWPGRRSHSHNGCSRRVPEERQTCKPELRGRRELRAS